MTWRIPRPTWSRPVPPTRWVPVVVVLALVGAAITGLVAAPVRAATSLGSLTISPETGQAISPITLTTVSSGASKGCPVGSGVVDGTITGPGGWAAGVPAISATAVGVSNTKDFTVDLSDTFSNIAAANGLTVLVGKYTIAVRCTDEASDDHGTFSGSLRFTSASVYQTTAPSAQPTTGPTPTTGAATATATSLGVSPSASAAIGAAVTLTATVTPATAAGTVTFRDSATNSAIGQAAVAGGQASITTVGLGVGSHSLTASFAPTSTAAFSASTSGAVAYTVTAATGGPAALGGLVLQPATGTAIDPLRARTVSAAGRTDLGCPTGTTSYTGTVVGPGGWSVGVLFVQSSANNLSTTKDFVVEVSDTFSNLAASNGLTVLAGRYDIALDCIDDTTSDSLGRFTGSIWFTDATNFQSTDPATSQIQTATVVSTNPADRVDLGAAVTLSATVTPPVAGKLQFQNEQNGTFATIGSAVTTSNGRATLKTGTLPFGLYYLSAVFTPSSPERYTTSTSPEVVFVVAKPIPPLPKSSSATIKGTVEVGSKLTCSASFSGAETRSYAWYVGATQVSTKSSYRPAKADAKKKLRCQALATNKGGTTYRYSVWKAVAR
ncbi:Ig-like domain repeat protein [Spongisporangium articulatum]|uniref:Ig-like domain repeat protein n=1 Tax=Spongisporangium articulatum TaxID=3362603 RepID=A0ABW8AGM9_9ACTN